MTILPFSLLAPKQSRARSPIEFSVQPILYVGSKDFEREYEK
jgi:hypothetical protein